MPPVPPAQRPGPIPGHRAARTCAGLLRILQRTWRQDPWENSMTPHSALKGHLPEPSMEGEARLLPFTRKPPAPGLSCARPHKGPGALVPDTLGVRGCKGHSRPWKPLSARQRRCSRSPPLDEAWQGLRKSREHVCVSMGTYRAPMRQHTGAQARRRQGASSAPGSGTSRLGNEACGGWGGGGEPPRPGCHQSLGSGTRWGRLCLRCLHPLPG